MMDLYPGKLVEWLDDDGKWKPATVCGWSSIVIETGTHYINVRADKVREIVGIGSITPANE